MKGITCSLLFSVCLSSALGVILHNPPTGRCPKDNSYYDSYAHANCSKFYICDWGYGIERDCPMSSATERLVFNPKLQVCDWKEDAVRDGAVCSDLSGPSTEVPVTPMPSTPSTLAPGVCPPNNEYYHSYPHANCSKFYICDWGYGIERDCPMSSATERLVFNPKLQVCDWKEDAVRDGAVCSDLSGPSTEVPVTPTPSTPSTLAPGVCPPNNEYYHSYPHANCSKFYICDWGYGIERDCPMSSATDRLVFNPKLQVCDWKEDAVRDGAVCSDVSNPSTEAPVTPTPSTPSTLTPGVCPPNNEYYHSYPHANCSKFYICDWGKGVEFDCPWADTLQTERLVFNPKLQVCDWREDAIRDGATCAAILTTPAPEQTTTTKSPVTSAPSGKCPPGNEYYHSYAHESDCAKFYKCDWGKGVEFDCPWANTAKTVRLTFNPKLQVCDWREDAIRDGATCAAILTTPAPEPEQTTTTTTSPVTSAPSGKCPPRNEYYHSYAHESDCAKFYKCDWGKGVEFDCPWANTAKTVRLTFNPKFQVCDWREDAIRDGATCAAILTTPAPEPEPTTTTKSPVTSGPSGKCPRGNEYYHSYAHESDCTKFYKCDWGKGVEFDCPWANTAKTVRLVFNPKLQVCDWKEDAIRNGAQC